MASNNNATNARAVAIQADGKIVVTGSAFMGTTPRNDIAVARYLSNGNLDTTFDGDGKAYVRFGNLDDYASGVSIQADGKILIAGSVNTDCCGGASDLGVARLTVAGKLDTTFDGDGMLVTPFLDYEYASDVIALGNGKILATGGYRNTPNQYSAVMVRYNANGSLDTTFSGDGKAERLSVSNLYPAVVVDGNGKYVTVSAYDVARYLSQ